MRYSTHDIEKAKSVDLYTYLCMFHEEDVTVTSEYYLKFNEDPSLCIKRGNDKWYDFSGKVMINGKKYGSNVDFLMMYYGYTFLDAIEELLNSTENITEQIKNLPEKKDFQLPPKDNTSYRNTFSYLTQTRKIPTQVVQNLIHSKLLYQTSVTSEKNDKTFKNIVFVNKDKNYIEVHGTISYGPSFYGCKKEKKDNYWMIAKENADTVYICEAAIDAISLFTLHCMEKKADRCAYVSIGGCNNYDTILRLMNEYKHPVLALDNDEAGDIASSHFFMLDRIIPKNKDWNEDLKEKCS